MSVKQEIKEECDISDGEQLLEEIETKPECYSNIDLHGNIELTEEITIKEESLVKDEELEENNVMSGRDRSRVDSSIVTRLRSKMNGLLKNEINKDDVIFTNKTINLYNNKSRNQNEDSTSHTKVERTDENLDILNETARSDGRYKCPECNYTTNQKHALTAHLRKKHADTVTLFCEYCAFSTVYQVSLKFHSRRHSNVKPYQCKFCPNKFFMRKAGLVKHLNRFHPDKSHQEIETFRCQKCFFKTHNAFSFKMHVCKPGRGGKYNCSTCGHVSFSRRESQKHVSSHKPKCQDCEFSCNGNVDLKSHDISKEHEELMLKCDKCEYQTCSTFHFKLHESIHEGKKGSKYFCQSCDYSTLRKNDLKRHIMKHSEEKPFSCQHCEFSCKRGSNLNQHMNKHHQDLCQRKLKMYQCEKCSFRVLDLYQLMLHKITHGETKNLMKFECSSCSYSTYYKRNLKNHMKRHVKKGPS